MNKERLELLCKDLDKEPPFDYSQWVDTRLWKGAQDLSCGAPACALGRACSIPELRKAGLLLFARVRGNDVVDIWIGLKGREAHNKVYTWCETAKACKAVFDISTEEAEWLFIPSYAAKEYARKPTGSATAKEVAAHIRQFIADGGMPEEWRADDKL